MEKNNFLHRRRGLPFLLSNGASEPADVESVSDALQ